MASYIARRKFLAMLGGSAAACPLAARAQQPAMPVVGLLSGGSAKDEPFLTDAFRKGLSETGYIEGKNLAMEYRYANHQNDRLPQLTAELVRRKVSVIAAVYSPAARAAMTATSEIPIVKTSVRIGSNQTVISGR
jgi:putative ABC transport system substrate-binding protein